MCLPTYITAFPIARTQVVFLIAPKIGCPALVHNGVITGRRYEGYLKKKKIFPDFSSLVERSLAIPETSGRFVRMVYRALADEIISFSKAAALLNTSVDNVKAQLQLV